MAEGLEDVWSRLSLTDIEAKIIEFDKEVPTEKKDEIALSLLGKLWIDYSFNPRVMKNVLRSVWKPSKGLVVRDLEDNLFVFPFF